MSGNNDIMSSLYSMCSLSYITLSDDSTFSVQDKGLLMLRSLYIPNFSFSLLLVNKITKVLNCSVKLYPRFCAFKKLEREKMIGTRHEKDGLRYLDLVSKLVVCSSYVPLFDHHCQLSHPSLSVLKFWFLSLIKLSL